MPPPPRRAGQGPRDERRRALSQNFLRDPRAVQTFLAALPPADGTPAVEVGTGDGALTAGIATHFGALTTWEVDEQVAAAARRRLRDLPHVTFETGDFLASRPPRAPFHLAGNIPFSATTRIVEWSLAAPALRSATFVTQWEFARKRSGDYGRWTRTTVLSWPWFDWALAGRVPRRAFAPVPATDAGVLRLTRRPTPLLPVADRARWERDVEAAFLGRGGSLFASLAEYHPRAALAAAFERAGLDQGVVVGFVHPDALVQVVGALGGRRPDADGPHRGADGPHRGADGPHRGADGPRRGADGGRRASGPPGRRSRPTGGRRSGPRR